MTAICDCRGATARTIGRRDPDCTLHCAGMQSDREGHPCTGAPVTGGLCRTHLALRDRQGIVLDARYVDFFYYRCRALIDGDRCEADSKADGGLCPEHEAMAHGKAVA